MLGEHLAECALCEQVVASMPAISYNEASFINQPYQPHAYLYILCISPSQK